jgi:citrate lyase synthetase
LVIIPRFAIDDEPVSASKIRKLISDDADVFSGGAVQTGANNYLKIF